MFFFGKGCLQLELSLFFQKTENPQCIVCDSFRVKVDSIILSTEMCFLCRRKGKYPGSKKPNSSTVHVLFSQIRGIPQKP